MPEFDPIWIVVFVSVLLNCMKPPGKIVTNILEIQSSICYELWFACRCTIELVELSIALISVLLNWMQKQGHTPCTWENATLIDMVVHWSSGDMNFSGVETRLLIVVEMRLLKTVETRLFIAVETRLSMLLRSDPHWDAALGTWRSR